MIRLLLLTLLLGNCALLGTETGGSEPGDRTYRIQGGDLLRVEVFGEPDLTLNVRVPADGRPVLPLLGELPSVVGKTLADFRADLKQRYEDGYLVAASLTVTVQEFMPRNAFVLGQVHTQGAVELTPFAAVTAMQAISRAGGFLAQADRKGSLLFRADPAHPGVKVIIPVPCADRPDDPTGDVVLQPDDLIVVPMLGGVVVIGKVRQAGAVPLPGQGTLTLTKAIALAGGFEKFARGDQVQLIRPGSPTVAVNATSLLDGSGHGEDPVLKPGDTIYVPDAKF